MQLFSMAQGFVARLDQGAIYYVVIGMVKYAGPFCDSFKVRDESFQTRLDIVDVGGVLGIICLQFYQVLISPCELTQIRTYYFVLHVGWLLKSIFIVS